MMTLSLWIFGVLLTIFTGTQGISDFPEDFVWSKRNDPVTLTCHTNIDLAVSWQFDGEVLEPQDDNQQEGLNLTLTGVDSPMLGEYSCWRGGEMLSATHLLLEAEEEEELDSLVSCWAKSYNCSFSCTWARSRYTAVRLGLGHDCSAGGKSCHWVSSSGQTWDRGFQFELKHSLSPYAEESTMLELTAEAIVDHSIARITKTFYLRDIVQPDSPNIVKCQVMGQKVNVTIEPPSSWSTPHSFFLLEHEIEYELRDNGKIERTLSSLILKSISRVRVRSRDPLVLSAWSHWTDWKNVMTSEMNLCKCRKKAKYCCPEIPPGSFDHCRERRKKGSN